MLVLMNITWPKEILIYMGKDIENITLRFVQVDSHPREDHSFNIKSIVNAFIPTTTIPFAPYSYQKAPDWFHSNANKWRFLYVDSLLNETAQVDLFTRKRDSKVFAGSFETTEFFRQVNLLCMITSLIFLQFYSFS